MRLHHCTWPEVGRYLETKDAIIVPIGSSEQHGPNGLIGTDCICPDVVADRAAAELEVLVGPTINVGMAQHHLAFTGTVALRPSTLIAVISDYVRSLSRNGFRRFYFLNGHGGNIPTVLAAFSEIHAEKSFAPGSDMPTVRTKLANWFQFPAVSALAKQFYGDRDGRHATASEIAVTQFALPDHIKQADMPPAGKAPRAYFDADDYRGLFPDGRIEADGFLARPEHGAQFVEASVAGVVEDASAFFKEP